MTLKARLERLLLVETRPGPDAHWLRVRGLVLSPHRCDTQRWRPQWRPVPGVVDVCEQPARSWRDVAPPRRLVLAGVAVVLLGSAVVVGRSDAPGVVAWGLLALGSFTLLAAVVLPTVQAVELGFPVGLKVSAAVRDRSAQLRDVFEDQRGQLELCAHLLCDDPAAAARLIEAACSRASDTWHHPVGPAVRPYVLCLLFHLLEEHHRLRPASGGDATASRLSRLDYSARQVVVLSSFLDLSCVAVAALLGRTEDEVQGVLAAAQQALAADEAP